jgi:aminopeptidase-like protein
MEFPIRSLMTSSELLPGMRAEAFELESLFDRLWPICRSITGEGLRESLRILSEVHPLRLHEIPSGARVFDWEVPKEWNIREAWIKGPDGSIVCDFRDNNLHVVNYSIPVKACLSLSELKPRLHSIPSMPKAIPYITSYYRENWGFCLCHDVLESLPEGEYEVYIDSELKQGSMTYGEIFMPGKSEEEILFSTYVCHPSMANNELSGPIAAIFLAREIASITERKYSYRFVFLPE